MLTVAELQGYYGTMNSYNHLIYVNATFRVVPSLFYKLFMQHVDQLLPVLYDVVMQKST